MSALLAIPSNVFLDRYEGLRARLPGITDPRARAAALFAAHGLPTVRDEAWKYTSLRPLADIPFADPPPDAPVVAPGAETGPDAPALVFVNGRARGDLSTAPAPSALIPSFAPLARPERDPLAALNAMLTEDGASIAIPPGQDAGTLHLISVAAGTASRPVSLHPRHRIALGAGATLTLIETARGEGVYLHNPVLEIRLAAGATLRHVRLLDDAPGAYLLSTLYLEAAARAHYDSFTFNCGAGLTRNEVHARLAGEGGSVTLNCAQLLRAEQHGDFTTLVAHDAPHCRSRQTVRTVLDGAARGVFQGRIDVAQIAQKTDGYQMNHALLLSPDAEMDSKPELHINADDVKCSHGATVGELDADQIFYLRSRGISPADARALLIRAFLAGSLEEVPDAAARALLEQAITAAFTRTS